MSVVDVLDYPEKIEKNGNGYLWNRGRTIGMFEYRDQNYRSSKETLNCFISRCVASNVGETRYTWC